MPLVDAALALAIHNALAQPPPPTAQVLGMAKSIVNELKVAGIVNIPPGMVVGVAPSSGGPLTNGAASNGIILGPNAASLTGQFVANMGLAGASPQILAMANAICTHIMTGKVTFAPNKVTGACSNTPVSPGALTGAAVGGTIIGLSGSAMAQLMGSAFGGVSPQLLAKCNAICTYIMANAQVSFIMGTIVGVCSAGGGPVAAGAGTGGTIQ
jgi:hypothetical protein